MNDCDVCRWYESEVALGKRIIMSLPPHPYTDEDRLYLRSCKAEVKRLQDAWHKHLHAVHQPELFPVER